MSPSGRVLMIDDNVEFAENVQEILVDEGIDAQVAADGPTGLQMIADNGYDLVITDMRMPGMNGLEVIRYIKEKWPGLPVIVISAYARDELLEAAEKEGALGILPKPVDLDFLSEFVAKVAKSDNKILIVEDDDAMRTNLTTIVLEVDAIVPLAARTAAEAVRLAEYGKVRGAIIDLRLPDGDGLELAAKLRAKSEHELPVVFITGHAGDFRENLEQVLSTNGVHLLEKPFRTDSLLGLVEQSLAGS